MSTIPSLFSVAAKELGIKNAFIDAEKSMLILHFANKNHFISNTKIGLIRNSEEVLGVDKAYQYELLKEKMIQPKTISYLDFHSKFSKLASFKSHEEIRKDIMRNFKFPLIVKKNRGNEGVNVYLVSSEKELEEKIKYIFNLHDKDYDYVLLAQEYIKPSREYRVLVYNQKIALVYLKDNSHATYAGNLSPLHWQNAKTVEVTDSKIMESLNHLCESFFEIWPLKYGGLDIIEDEMGKFWLIEVNTSPSVALFIKDNGNEKIIKLFQEILLELKAKYS